MCRVACGPPFISLSSGSTFFKAQIKCYLLLHAALPDACPWSKHVGLSTLLHQQETDLQRSLRVWSIKQPFRVNSNDQSQSSLSSSSLPGSSLPSWSLRPQGYVLVFPTNLVSPKWCHPASGENVRKWWQDSLRQSQTWTLICPLRRSRKETAPSRTIELLVWENPVHSFLPLIFPSALLYLSGSPQIRR